VLTAALGGAARENRHISENAAGAVGGLGDRLTKGFDQVATASAKADQDAARLDQALFENKLRRAKTNAAKIALLRQREAGISDPTERARIEGQILDLQNQRVGSAQSTADKLNDIAVKSGQDQERILRENLERLRDAQEDYDVKRTRSKEDEDRKIKGLLARGERGAAAREREDFARQQQRDQEDFDRQQRRTVRNNREALGDQGVRVDNQVAKATRTPLSGADGSPVNAPAVRSAPQAAGVDATSRIIQLMLNASVLIDGKVAGRVIYDAGLKEIIDTDLAFEIAQLQTTGQNQAALAGAP
jgi:hypothetical protein